jgi:Zn-dependent protease with chaperone function
MIHLLMLGTGWGIALLLRLQWLSDRSTNWSDRWNITLLQFLLPPLLLITTAIALLWMGPIGQMVHGWQGWLTYGWAIGFLLLLLFTGWQLLSEALRSAQRIRQYPITAVPKINSPANSPAQAARLIPLELPFIAQIGLWQPQLVISQGLLSLLEPQHLEAVLVHEAAHQHYRDTFWFFWLGWLRRCSCYLPNTEALWQELLLLREMRADRWAAQMVNPLLLAEALFIVVSAPVKMEYAAAFNGETALDRLDERINALLAPPVAPPAIAPLAWQTITITLLSLLPLLVIPFHR